MFRGADVPDYNHNPTLPRVITNAELATITAFANEFVFTSDAPICLYVEQGGTLYPIGGPGHTFPSVAITNGGWIGLGAAKGRIQFDDEATDEISFLSCVVNLPSAETKIGNIRIWSYVDDALADDATVDLPDATDGMLTVMWYNSVAHGYGDVRIKNDGTIISATGSGITYTDTDGFFCVFDNGTKATIKNRTGEAAVVRAVYHYQ